MSDNDKLPLGKRLELVDRMTSDLIHTFNSWFQQFFLAVAAKHGWIVANEYLPTRALVFKPSENNHAPTNPLDSTILQAFNSIISGLPIRDNQKDAISAQITSLSVSPPPPPVDPNQELPTELPYELMSTSQENQVPAFREDNKIMWREETHLSTRDTRTTALVALTSHLSPDLNGDIAKYNRPRPFHPYLMIRALYERSKREATSKASVLRKQLDTLRPEENEEPHKYVARGFSIGHQLSSALGVECNEDNIVNALAQGLSRSSRYSAVGAIAESLYGKGQLNRHDIVGYMTGPYRQYIEQREKAKRKPDNYLNHENQRSNRKHEHAKKFQKSSSSSSSSSSKQSKYCSFHKSRSHNEDECYHLHPELRAKNPFFPTADHHKNNIAATVSGSLSNSESD